MSGPGPSDGPVDAPSGGPSDAASGGPVDGWADVEARVEEVLLRGPRHLTRADVREVTGIDAGESTRLWTALGFATTPEDEASFTDADAEALRLTGQLLDDDTFDEGEALAVARTLGQSMSRLAEWQATLLRRTIAERGSADDPEAVVAAVETLVPVLEHLQSYTWRRHLAVTASRMLTGLAHAGESGDEDVTVVGFADIVGFTALSRRIDSDELRSLLERFEARSADVVVRSGGRIVKTLGDEVLFVCPDTSGALDIAFALHDEIPDDDGHLALRVGLARGEVLARYGDVYGPVVNIASRLTSHARPGTVLLDDGMTDAVRGAEIDVSLRAVPALDVRGYKHLKPHVVRRRRS